MTLVDTLHITLLSADEQRVEATMPITPALHQPFGFLHGGATIALLETVASVGAERNANLQCERPFGTEVHVHHRKSAAAGALRGVATLERQERSSFGSTKQFWDVVAYDDAGEVVSDGVIVTKIVSLERLAQKERERTSADEDF